MKGKRLDCMIKLIATDMDGTLLDERGEVDLPRLERLLDHLDQKGIRFVIATEMKSIACASSWVLWSSG